MSLLGLLLQSEELLRAIQWRADSISRRLGILNKSVTTISHSGKTSSRGNINFKLIEDKYICDFIIFIIFFRFIINFSSKWYL